MKEPELAANIVREMKRAIGDTPLSVKIRLGWDDPDTFKTFIPAMEEAGAELITMHGRTKAQGYSGTSDWKRIAQAKEIATVPFLANGDIHEPQQVPLALQETNADGVLIARGALGNPWFFKQAQSAMRHPEERSDVGSQGTTSNGATASESLPVQQASFAVARNDVGISFDQRIRIILEHARLHVENSAKLRALAKKNLVAGVTAAELEKTSIVTFRKHLSWYFKSSRFPLAVPGIKEYRSELVRIQSIEELEGILQRLKEHIKNTSD